MPNIKTDNMVFVFGSNLGGIHGAGAAKYARLYRGAQMGIGVGRTGQSYAIPTKDKQIRATLRLNEIRAHVEEFLRYARERPNIHFQVTCIGCGLAGLKHEDIAPLFRNNRADVLPNLWFDELWKNYLCSNAKFWGTF